ncbi:MAG: AAA family ATPase [Planctomycetes bacterium]|nr:AAA family ATPase [Planctomycetota bacterium]
MLTRLHIRNFKRFEEADIELGQTVVLIGPNNSGKTTALQALALWEGGVRRWNERREGKTSPEKRPGVTINRRELISIPVPNAKVLWRDLHVKNVEQIKDQEGKKKQRTKNVFIDVTVDGVTAGNAWTCGMEFYYANEESFYCRPLRADDGPDPGRMVVPPEAGDVRVAFLPPMSGLAAVEPKWEPGRINVLIGEGQTAQVLRNLCYDLYDRQDRGHWGALVEHIQRLFGVTLNPPRYVAARGEITMDYTEESGLKLDLSSSGRGLQQTLLILAHLYANTRTVLLLDEPDAHLEILRQRQIYQLLTEMAEKQGSQIIAASHSEIVLDEAADRDVVIAFVGRPHRIDNGGSQVRKALRNIGFDQYYQAEQTGWVLYVEDSTDLDILRAFARTLGHEAEAYLERPFVHYVATNLPQRARDHFFGLREAKPDLVGVALFDRLEKKLQTGTALCELMWSRREIENYFCKKDVLLRFAVRDRSDNLFDMERQDEYRQAMLDAIEKVEEAGVTFGKPSPWSPDIKASDDFLDPLFKEYFKRLRLPLLTRKSDYHLLAALVQKDEMDPEVKQMLDKIVAVARTATPRND